MDNTLLRSGFRHFSRITTSPLFGDQFSVRLDGRDERIHTLFVRHSHDGSRAVCAIAKRWQPRIVSLAMDSPISLVRPEPSRTYHVFHPTLVE